MCRPAERETAELEARMQPACWARCTALALDHVQPYVVARRRQRLAAGVAAQPVAARPCSTTRDCPWSAPCTAAGRKPGMPLCSRMLELQAEAPSPDSCVQHGGLAFIAHSHGAGPAACCIQRARAGLQSDWLVAPGHKVGAGGVGPRAGPRPLAGADDVLVKPVKFHRARSGDIAMTPRSR